MKNLIFVLILLITFSACSKIEDVEPLKNNQPKIKNSDNSNSIENQSGVFEFNSSKISATNSKAAGGDIIKGDGWLGWIDPELVEGDIPDGEIFKEDPKWHGYPLVDENGNVYGINCPTSGSDCGRLYTYDDPSSLPRFVGLYLVL